MLLSGFGLLLIWAGAGLGVINLLYIAHVASEHNKLENEVKRLKAYLEGMSARLPR